MKPTQRVLPLQCEEINARLELQKTRHYLNLSPLNLPRERSRSTPYLEKHISTKRLRLGIKSSGNCTGSLDTDPKNNKLWLHKALLKPI